ncbi:MAG: hypothetical protein ACL93V_11895 [Candidatus Electrothrix sp. YB6]
MKRLKTILEVFSDAWDLYTRRALSVLLVTLLAPVITVIVLAGCGAAAFIGLGGEQAFTGDLRQMLLNPAVLGAGAAFILLAGLMITWCQTAVLTVAVDEERDILGGLAAGWKYVFSLLWIGSLYFGIIMTGMLLIVPGLVLALSMSLCFYIMIEEEITGIDTLMASRLYMRGHWWNTLLKFLPVWLLSLLIGLIPVAGQVLAFLFTPFVLFYGVVVYRNLKEVTGEVDPSDCCRPLWVLMGTFGMLLPLLAFVGAVLAFGPRLQEKLPQIQHQVNQIVGSEIFPLQTGGAGLPSVLQLASVDGFLVWRDPVNDTHNPLLDIREVSAKGDAGELQLRVRLARPFADYFAAAKAGRSEPLVSFYLDTDQDRATGGSPFSNGQGRNGYDMDIEVQLRAQSAEQNTPAGVNTGIYRVDRRENRSFQGTLDDSAVKITGDTLTIRLPYSQLSTTGKGAVRICYRETGQQTPAEDKLVPLK